MEKRITINGGYVGLLILLVTAVIITFLFWRSEIFRVKSENGEPAKNIIKQDMEAIEQAKFMKDALEKRDKQMLVE